ncbi:MAG: hypothetical protein M3247_08870 [Thermoproteota archaeon]|nr:hypothetical protein [Thermoproteota archaeon]
MIKKAKLSTIAIGLATIAIVTATGSTGWGQQIAFAQATAPEVPSNVQNAQPATSSNQTGVNKTVTFVDVHINMTKDGKIKSIASSSQSINGTDEQLREQFANLMQSRAAEYYNLDSITFINSANGTAQTFGRGQATPNVFTKWFEETLAQMSQGASPSEEAGLRAQKFWTTVCTEGACASTHD